MDEDEIILAGMREAQDLIADEHPIEDWFDDFCALYANEELR